METGNRERGVRSESVKTGQRIANQIKDQGDQSSQIWLKCNKHIGALGTEPEHGGAQCLRYTCA